MKSAAVASSNWVVVGVHVAMGALGLALAVVSLSGLIVIDQAVAGSVSILEARAYDALWRTLLVGLMIVAIPAAVLRRRWVNTWLGVADVPKEVQDEVMRERLGDAPPVDRNLYRANSFFTWVSVAGFVAAIGVSLAGDDATALRLSFLGKALAGSAIVGASAAAVTLIRRNRPGPGAEPREG